MITARVKRHTKILLNHPIRTSGIPLLVVLIASSYMFSLALFFIGYKVGALQKDSNPNTQVNLNNDEYIEKDSYINLNQVEYSEDLLQMDETDEEVNSQMDEMLLNLDSTKNSVASNSSAVLASNNYENAPLERAIPAERRMYTEKSLNKNVPDINVVSVENGLSLQGVILPILALGLAILSVNYIEHKALLRTTAKTKVKRKLKKS